ncbi:hypothetical protein EI94DRAFT_1683667 [Lactarius quietus]|nr:hypothetical protein EI94DRAFT_1683667 [Lactarius quietus]
MPRIVEDPTHAICLNFDGPEWEFFRQSTIAAHQGDQPLTAEEAVQHLKEAWTHENEHLVVTWIEQLEQDQAEQIECDRLAQEEEACHTQQNAEPEVQRSKLEKRKNKSKIFNPDRVIAEWLGPRPSQYALSKIENMEYVELDYFTLKGCKDTATDTDKSVDSDTLALAQLGGSIAVKLSRHIRNDGDLGWEEMMDAKNIMLHFMNKSRTWPEAHTESMATFFFNLDLHPRKMQTNGKTALLLYQSCACHEWHDALEHDEGFNIQIIQDELLCSYGEEVNDAIRERDDAKRHRDDTT